MNRFTTGAPAKLSVTFYADETPVVPTGTVTVSVKYLDGTVAVSGTATVDATAKTANYTLAARTQPVALTVEWTGTTDGYAQTIRQFVDITDGRIFQLADGRASDSALSSLTKYPTAKLEVARARIEDEFERITGRSFIPRYARVVLDGSGSDTVYIPDCRDLRQIVAATVGGVAVDVETLQVDSYGAVRLSDGSTWTLGALNVVLEYTYGMDYPPEDVRRAALIRLRSFLTSENSGIPDRATSFQMTDGGSYSLATPGRGGSRTGIPDVDAVLLEYRIIIPGVG